MKRGWKGENTNKPCPFLSAQQSNTPEGEKRFAPGMDRAMYFKGLGPTIHRLNLG